MSSQRATSVTPIEDVNVEIGRRVHQLMWDRHVSQTEFGKRIGMDQSSVAKRLRGNLGWSATHIKQAAAALDTTAAYLFGETANPEPTGPEGLTRKEG